MLRCNSGKSPTKTRVTSLVLKCSSGKATINGSLRSCVRLAFSHQHPAWHIVDCQQRYLIVLESLDALLESCDLVSDALAPFPLELVRGKEHLEALTLLLWSLLSKLGLKPGHQGVDAVSVSVSLSLSVVGDVSRCGQQLLVSHRQTHTSRCSLQPTNQSRCN